MAHQEPCQPRNPVEYDDITKKNIKNVILALEELDDNVIAIVRDLVLVRDGLNVTISEADLRRLEGDRESTYLSSDYSIEDMFEYLEVIPRAKWIWLAAMRSLSKAYTTDPARDSFDWKYRIRGIENAGDKAWKAVVAAARNFPTSRGAVIINNIIDHFRVFDDFLDLVPSESGALQERERFSDELEDTL